MTDNNRREYAQTVALSLYDIHVAILDSHAKDEGFTRSEAGRHIIEEWAQFKADQAGLAVQDSDDGR